jgi:hypothetical protein
VSWLRQCADWLAHLDADSYPPAVNLRPSADWPDRAVMAVDLARVAAVIDRIAADVDELARARRVQDLNTAAVLPDPRAASARRGWRWRSSGFGGSQRRRVVCWRGILPPDPGFQKSPRHPVSTLPVPDIRVTRAGVLRPAR